jgi:hypothetical protein
MRFNIKKTDLKGMGIYANESIPAYDVISKIKYIREVTCDTPLLESEKHLQDHIHYWPDGRMLYVDELILILTTLASLMLTSIQLARSTIL